MPVAVCLVHAAREVHVGTKKLAFRGHRPVVRHTRAGKGEIDRRGLRLCPRVQLHASAHVLECFVSGVSMPI
jgi:hypothetical protein